jgi:pimeloyl-ACP methyl ester carboxylesterase
VERSEIVLGVGYNYRMQLKQSILKVDNEEIVCESLIRKDNVVILHGAGASNRKRFYALAMAILRRGVGVVLFDFSSHGDSTGERKDLSLKRRRVQAQKIIDTFIPQKSKVYFVGFSMSGQTVCDLLPFYKGRVPAVLLGCPAVYTNSVQDLNFGEEFTTKIRGVDSWKDSTAFEELRVFEGKTIIAIGDEDQVIPSQVITSLKKSAKHVSLVEYPGVDHQLAVWLAAHEKEQDKLLDLLMQSSSLV